MKTLFVLLAVLAIGFSYPQPRKPFHEHVEDFLSIIYEEAEDDFDDLLDECLLFEECKLTLDFMSMIDFKKLVFEMESLPEFNAVVDFLENHNIDVLYFIEMFNYVLDQVYPRSSPQIRGKDFSSLIAESIALFPKAKLSALFDQKMAEEEDFRNAIVSLQSEEWQTVWNALWDNDTFKAQAQILSDKGIDLKLLLDEVIAIFGQN